MKTSHRFVVFEGGLKLQVVPVSEDVGEGGLVRAEASFTGLEEKKTQQDREHLIQVHHDDQKKEGVMKKKTFHTHGSSKCCKNQAVHLK